MGQAKRMLEEIEARGWASVDAWVCPDCLDDPVLKAAVKQAADARACGYCGEESDDAPLAAPVDVILPLIVDGLRAEYEDPVEQCPYDSSEGGWQLFEPQDTWDVLQDHEATADDGLLAALSNAIDGQWVQRDPFRPSPHQALVWGWEGFRRYVTHERRYTFLLPQPGAVQHREWGEIPPEDVPAALAQAIADGGLARVLPAGTRLFRARPHGAHETFDRAADLGSPPPAVAKTNRMSAAGISAFYGASAPEGAVAEVRAYSPGGHMTVAEFVTDRPLPIVDLVELPDIPSLFDADRRHLRAALRFLHNFARDVARPAEPSDQQRLDYVPTQVMAEYLRHEFEHPDGQVAGLRWRSSVNPAVASCVLFVPNDRCVAVCPGWDSSPEPVLGLVPGSPALVPPGAP
jgi:hypothetical protein